MSEWTIIDTFADRDGQPVSIGVKGPLVGVAILPDRAVLLDGDARDRFMRAFAAAEIEAEREVSG